MKKYIVTKSYSAPNMSAQSGAKLMTKDFMKGTPVVGKLHEIPKSNFKYPPSIIVDGSFVIPLANLEEVNVLNVTGTEQEEIQSTPPVVAPEPNKAPAVTGEKVNYKIPLIGLGMGAIAGFATAKCLKKSVILFTSIGLLSGAAIGYAISRNK